MGNSDARRTLRYALAVVGASSLAACTLVAALDDHIAGIATGGPAGDSGGSSSGSNPDATDPNGELEIAITPNALTVLPGDVLSIDVRLLKRPAGTVALRIEGTGFVGRRVDGAPEPSGGLPPIDAARERRSVLVDTDPNTPVGTTLTATIIATSDRPRLTQSKQLVVKTTSLDATFGAAGMLLGNRFASISIEDYVVSLLPNPSKANYTIAIVEGYPGQNDAGIGQGDVYVASLVANGGFDPAINAGYGYWRYDLPNGAFRDQTAHASTIAPRGDGSTRVVTVGTVPGASGLLVHVCAFLTTTLTLDTSFNGSGYVDFDAPGGPEGALSVAAQPDGKIVAGGFSEGNTLTLFRLSANGASDGSFGVGGIAKYTMPAVLAPRRSLGVAIGGGGSIFFAASAVTVPDAAADDGLLLAKASATGPLDMTFGTGGVARATIAAAPTSDHARAIAIDSSGRLLVAGTSFFDADRREDVVVARFDPSGALDTTFGPEKRGWVATDLALGAETPVGLALDGAGNVFVAAKVGETKTAVLRYDSSGELTGIYGPSCCTRVMTPSTIAVQPDGKVLVGGWTNATPNRDSAIMRIVP